MSGEQRGEQRGLMVRSAIGEARARAHVARRHGASEARHGTARHGTARVSRLEDRLDQLTVRKETVSCKVESAALFIEIVDRIGDGVWSSVSNANEMR